MKSRHFGLGLVATALVVGGLSGGGLTISGAGAVSTAPAAPRLAVTPLDARADAVISRRVVVPSTTDCDHTDYLPYATAALWFDEDVADVNAKLASLKISQIGDPAPSCDPKVDESHNNLFLSYLIRPYMLYSSRTFPGRLSSAASNNLLAQMWQYAHNFSKVREAADTWSIFDSENHDAQAESFYFLAAQAFKDTPAYAKRKYADGSTVAQQYKAWHDHWSNYFDERAKRGLFIEVGAPSYTGYTMEAILNIYNFADDRNLRKKAKMVLDLQFADYAIQQLNGVRGGAKSRSYPDASPDGANDNMTNLGNYLFGLSVAVKPDNHALALATSGYTVPAVVQALATGHASMGSFADITRRPGDGLRFFDKFDDWHVSTSKSVLDYTYVTPDYIMGTAELDPGDPHIAPSSQNRWQGIIFNTTSDARVYPQAAPTSVTPTNDAFLSVQNKNVLITEKQAYLTQPTLVYFSNSLDSLVEQHGWLFVQEGSAYLAVRPALGGYHWLTAAKNLAASPSRRFIALSNVSSPIVFEAAPAASYPSFQAFQSRILANPLSDTGGALHYTGSDGTRFTFFNNTAKAPKVNGVAPNYAPADVFNSPYMTSVFGSGKINISFGGQSASYDFSNPTNPVDTFH